MTCNFKREINLPKNINLYRCPICGKMLTFDNVARKENGNVRTDISERPWCKTCTNQFDKVER